MMSHFVIYVLVQNEPKSLKEAENAVGPLLEPYSENLEVEEYQKKCYCIGSNAVWEAKQEADKRFGTHNELREAFFATHDKDYAKAEWMAYLAPRIKFEDETIANHPDKDLPDSECEECQGTGSYLSTYNPKSQWDWWVVGGRWSGIFEENSKALKGNMISTAELAKLTSDFKWCAYALVTPDGEWHEQGKMGWWGMSSDEKDDDVWHKEFQELLAKYPDTYAIVVDCHI